MRTTFSPYLSTMGLKIDHFWAMDIVVTRQAFSLSNGHSMWTVQKSLVKSVTGKYWGSVSWIILYELNIKTSYPRDLWQTWAGLRELCGDAELLGFLLSARKEGCEVRCSGQTFNELPGRHEGILKIFHSNFFNYQFWLLGTRTRCSSSAHIFITHQVLWMPENLVSKLFHCKFAKFGEVSVWLSSRMSVEQTFRK